MGTPLKLLSTRLSPRVLSPISPLSPNFLALPNKYENVIPRKPYQEARRATSVVKKLEFCQKSSPKYKAQPVEVKVTDYTFDRKETVEDILINTPNKRNISTNGIDANRCHNVLGVGSFGKVIRGIYKGETVAVKVVRNTLSLGEKNALNVNHNNIVRTLDIIQNQDGYFSLVIMKYFPNSKQLSTLLYDPDFKMEENVINFAVDICKGLEFIHRRGLLHLDIKPQNILVADGVCKICDFGNSVFITETESFTHQGTAIYTAPELLQGKLPTEKCDTFSLGIVLWQLRSKCQPYGDLDNVETVMYKVVKCNWRPENVGPRDDYSELYQACWDTEPSRRPFVWDLLLKLNEML